MKDVDIELLFIDDGSTDLTLSLLKDFHEMDSRCHYLSFSRNFGKEAANRRSVLSCQIPFIR